MRPIYKPNKDKEYNPYQTAKHDLFIAIGAYCSYCERPIDVSGAVEHVMPKSLHENKKTKWDNFLLSCTNCNSCKGKKDINDDNINNYAWPDVDNTYKLIEYDSITSLPKAAEGLSEDEAKRANNLISLVGLDKPAPEEGSVDYQKASDNRIAKRSEVRRLSQKCKTDFLSIKEDSKETFIDLLENLVKAEGCWSIWMHEFEGIPELKSMMLNCINGTRKEFFK